MSEKISPAYAAWHELRHFVGQTTLSLIPQSAEVPVRKRLYELEDQILTSERSIEGLDEEVIAFIRGSCKLAEALAQEGLGWPGGAGPAVEGVGLERLIIAAELDRRCGGHKESWWREDIANILSFFSQTSQRRYEKSNPQLTVAYYPTEAERRSYGILGKSLLDEYKALLRLFRDGHTIVKTDRGCTITGIDDNKRFDPQQFLDLPAPPRLAHLQQLSQSSDAIVFNLNPNASMEIFCRGSLVAFGPGNASRPRRQTEGVRTAAARFVSQTGLAIKVSSDGDAIAQIQGKEQGPLV